MIYTKYKHVSNNTGITAARPHKANTPLAVSIAVDDRLHLFSRTCSCFISLAEHEDQKNPPHLHLESRSGAAAGLDLISAESNTFSLKDASLDLLLDLFKA